MPRIPKRTVVLIEATAGFLAVWEVFCRLFRVPDYLLPPPSAIFVEFWSALGWYLMQAGYTLLTTMAGFGLALVIGFVAALGIVYSKFLENTLYALLVSTNSIPKIALAPLFIVWLGTGAQAKVAVSFLIALFAIVVDTVLGLRSADPGALELMKTMRSTRLQVLLMIRLPNALPYMFAGMKVAISLSLVGAIAGEFVASQDGLGFVILQAQGQFQTSRVFVAILLLGVIGTLLFMLVSALERLICPWHVSQRITTGEAGV